MFGLSDPISLFLMIAILGILPFIVVLMTSYVKLVVIFGLVRSALGVQQVPPMMAMNGLAIILTLYIMAPVGFSAFNALQEKGVDLSGGDAIEMVVEVGKEPFRSFLVKHSTLEERSFFANSTQILWPANEAQTVTTQDFLVAIPAFAVSELTKAFEIGFLLYLPFIAIDLIISNILLAMGMMMVSPLTISLPFKLFLFVMVDGWTRLIHGVILTYQ